MKPGFWLDRPILVTGATGLVGSWLVKELVKYGAEVICLVRDWVPQSEFVRTHLLDRVRVVRGDIRDQDLLERTMGEYQIDTIFHLAAQTIVTIANANPISTFESNIKGTWCLLEAARRSPKVKQVVIASSDKAYGDSNVLPYNENTPLNGIYPYDVSKSCADLISRSYAVSFSVPIVITRCGNFFGGGDLNWNRIIPGTIRSIIRGKPPVIRSDGKFIRDYFYVEDGVHAYLTLAEHLSKNPEIRGKAFNFSTETPKSVIEIVELILRSMNSSLIPEVQNQTSNEILKQYLDASEARSSLGWEPMYGLELGMQKTIEWYQNFFKGIK